MRLPAELLLMILKLCLEPTKPIRSAYGPGDEYPVYHDPTTCVITEKHKKRQKKLTADYRRKLLDAFDAQSQFSTQLLRCCQRLYYEGRPLLYDNAELMVFCDHRYISIQKVRIDKDDLFDDDCWPVMYASINDLKPHEQQVKETLNILQRFQRINVVLGYSLQTEWNPWSDLTTSIMGIRHQLHDKDVRVTLHEDELTPAEIEYAERVLGRHLPFKIRYLSSLSYWRCRSLAIDIHGTGTDEASKTSIIRTVTSGKPVYDLVNPYERLSTEFRTAFREHSSAAPIRVAMEAAADAAYSGDIHALLKKLDEIRIMARSVDRFGNCVARLFRFARRAQIEASL